MKWFKKPIEVKFEVYETSGNEATREGSAPYDVGDYRMTGVEGEVWPMKPEVFKENYKIISTRYIYRYIYKDEILSGTACKKKVLVDVKFATEETEVKTSWGATLKAKPGDAIVTAKPGDSWVVTKSIFNSTYSQEIE